MPYAESSSKIVIFYEFKKWNKKNLPGENSAKNMLQFYVNWKKFVTAIGLVLYEQPILLKKKWFFSISITYKKFLINNFTQFFIISTLHEHYMNFTFTESKIKYLCTKQGEMYQKCLKNCDKTSGT